MESGSAGSLPPLTELSFLPFLEKNASSVEALRPSFNNLLRAQPRGYRWAIWKGSAVSDSHTQLRQIGPYEVVRLIGEGPSGRVFLAKLGGRELAIKVFEPELSPDFEFLKRYQKDGRVGSTLQHPNIVDVLDVGMTESSPYVVSDFISGSNLKTVIGSAKRPNWHRATEIAAQAFEALEHAHRNSVIHRNMKPTNILLDAGGKAVLTDFSLAPLKEGARGSSGSLLNAPEYKAPEQLDSVSVDSRADLYSAALVFYELLTGVYPYRGKNMGEIVRAQLFVTPTSPETFNPDIPQPLADLIMQCLSKKPGDRPAKAGEVADKLREFLRRFPFTESPSQPIGVSETRPASGSLHPIQTVLLVHFSFAATSSGNPSGALHQRELRDRLSYVLRRSPAEDLQWSNEGATVIFLEPTEALRCARGVYSELAADRYSLKMAVSTGPLFSDPEYSDRPSLGEFACKTMDRAHQISRDTHAGQIRIDEETRAASATSSSFTSVARTRDGAEVFLLAEDGSVPEALPTTPLSSLKAERESSFLSSGSLTPPISSFDSLKDIPPTLAAPPPLWAKDEPARLSEEPPAPPPPSLAPSGSGSLNPPAAPGGSAGYNFSSLIPPASGSLPETPASSETGALQSPGEENRRKPTLARSPLPDRTPQRTMEVFEARPSRAKGIVAGLVIVLGLGGAAYKFWPQAKTPAPPANATLTVECKPDKIEINLDKAGRKPYLKGASLEVSSGNHTAEFSAKGYKKQTKTFTAKAGAPVKLEVKLAKGK